MNCRELWPLGLNSCEGRDMVSCAFLNIQVQMPIKIIKMELLSSMPAGFSPGYASIVNAAIAKPPGVLLPALARIHFMKFNEGRLKVIRGGVTKKTRLKRVINPLHLSYFI